MINIGIIGGTGVYSPDLFTNSINLELDTPYGKVSLMNATYKNCNVYFLERHGKNHSIPPHQVNYRANIWALKQLNVKRILSTAAVGSINPLMVPGDFVILDQFIDFTKNRPATFFEDGNGVVHIDMTEPYCYELRNILINGCKNSEINFFKNGTYVCTQGPRFETCAEIKMFKIFSGDVVGMTNVPEVVLAREANICYATVAMVTNFAAGISNNILTQKEVIDNMTKMSDDMIKLLLYTLENIKSSRECQCKNATCEINSLK